MDSIKSYIDFERREIIHLFTRYEFKGFGTIDIISCSGKGSRRKKNRYFTVRLYYDYMRSEMDFTPEKSFSSNYKNSQLLLTAAAALSQSGQIAAV